MFIEKLNIKINCHSSICINNDIFIDPYNIEEVTFKARVIFITHPHYDHLDKSSIQALCDEKTKFVCPENAVSALVDIGISPERITVVKPGSTFSINEITGEAFAAYNQTKSFHPKQNEWVGYLLNIEGISYMICGDTDLNDELKEFKPDVLFVPIGATYTMNAAEAATLSNIIKPKVVIPVHYGTIVGGKREEDLFLKSLNKNQEYLLLVNL